MVICAAGLSPVRGLPHRKRPHYCLLTPSPSCAAGSLASARSPRTARIPQARRLLCSSTGQRCCLAHAGVLHGVLTRRAHTARSHGVRTTQRLAFAAAATSSLLLRPGLFPARSSRLPRVPRQEGRWATARASTARSEVNYSPSISARQARRVGRARCAVLASHPLRRALSTSIPRTPAHNLRVRRTLSCLATSLVGAAPSRRSMPKSTMPDRRCRRRRQLLLPLCLLSPPRRLCVCDRRGMRVGVWRLRLTRLSSTVL